MGAVAATRFRDEGYDPHAPGWPGDGDTVEASRANPDAIGDHGIDDVVAHFAGVIDGAARAADPRSGTRSAG